MPATIRLTRGGGKKMPHYRVVATDSRFARNGRFIEQLGIYQPLSDPPVLRFDGERLEYWLKVGARPSDTVGRLIRRYRRQQKTAPAAVEP